MCPSITICLLVLGLVVIQQCLSMPLTSSSGLTDYADGDIAAAIGNKIDNLDLEQEELLKEFSEVEYEDGDDVTIEKLQEEISSNEKIEDEEMEEVEEIEEAEEIEEEDGGMEDEEIEILDEEYESVGQGSQDADDILEQITKEMVPDITPDFNNYPELSDDVIEDSTEEVAEDLIFEEPEEEEEEEEEIVDVEGIDSDYLDYKSDLLVDDFKDIANNYGLKGQNVADILYENIDRLTDILLNNPVDIARYIIDSEDVKGPLFLIDLAVNLGMMSRDEANELEDEISWHLIELSSDEPISVTEEQEPVAGAGVFEVDTEDGEILRVEPIVEAKTFYNSQEQGVPSSEIEEEELTEEDEVEYITSDIESSVPELSHTLPDVDTNFEQIEQEEVNAFPAELEEEWNEQMFSEEETQQDDETDVIGSSDDVTDITSLTIDELIELVARELIKITDGDVEGFLANEVRAGRISTAEANQILGVVDSILYEEQLQFEDVELEPEEEMSPSYYSQQPIIAEQQHEEQAPESLTSELQQLYDLSKLQGASDYGNYDMSAYVPTYPESYDWYEPSDANNRDQSADELVSFLLSSVLTGKLSVKDAMDIEQMFNV